MQPLLIVPAGPSPARRRVLRRRVRLIVGVTIAYNVVEVSFSGLAVFVSYEAVRSLLLHQSAEHSVPGVVLAAMSLAVMPLLSWAERRTGREIGSSSVADSKQTLLYTYLSAVVLVGLAANSLSAGGGPTRSPRW